LSYPGEVNQPLLKSRAESLSSTKATRQTCVLESEQKGKNGAGAYSSGKKKGIGPKKSEREIFQRTSWTDREEERRRVGQGMVVHDVLKK